MAGRRLSINSYPLMNEYFSLKNTRGRAEDHDAASNQNAAHPRCREPAGMIRARSCPCRAAVSDGDVSQFVIFVSSPPACPLPASAVFGGEVGALVHVENAYSSDKSYIVIFLYSHTTPTSAVNGSLCAVHPLTLCNQPLALFFPSLLQLQYHNTLLICVPLSPGMENDYLYVGVWKGKRVRAT